MHFLDLNVAATDRRLTLIDRLAVEHTTKISSTVGEALAAGIPISEIPPLTPLYLEFG
jgi:hypothetical protein